MLICIVYLLAIVGVSPDYCFWTELLSVPGNLYTEQQYPTCCSGKHHWRWPGILHFKRIQTIGRSDKLTKCATCIWSRTEPCVLKQTPLLTNSESAAFPCTCIWCSPRFLIASWTTDPYLFELYAYRTQGGISITKQSTDHLVDVSLAPVVDDFHGEAVH